MDNAKMAEQIAGPLDFAREPTVTARPFSSPRREGPIALLMAREMAT